MGKRFAIVPSPLPDRRAWHRPLLLATAVAVAFSAVAACLHVPRGEAAAFPGENGRIAFQSDRSGDWEIYTMSDTGRDLMRLTKNDIYDGQPAISPDGRKIAFIRNSSRPAPPPPGAQAGSAAERFGDLWIMNSDGSNERQITDRKNRTPAFSPDGKRITFSSVSYNGCALNLSWENIFVITISTTATQKLTQECDPSFNPSFSPDGSEILFQGKRICALCSASDGVLSVNSQLTQPDPVPRLVGRVPADSQMKGFSLSSDNKDWAYSLRKHNTFEWGEPQIFVGPAAGGGGIRQIGARWQLRTLVDDVRPSFAPAGDWVAFERRADDATNIYKVSSTGNPAQHRQLTATGNNMAPDWGPKPKP
jgi:Tol biopolymer transport system component